MSIEQSEDTTVVNAVTGIVRAADQHFERVGGSSRHWVRDCFLPMLNRAGWVVVMPALPPQGVECGWCAGKGWLAEDDPAFTVGALKKGEP